MEQTNKMFASHNRVPGFATDSGPWRQCPGRQRLRVTPLSWSWANEDVWDSNLWWPPSLLSPLPPQLSSPPLYSIFFSVSQIKQQQQQQTWKHITWCLSQTDPISQCCLGAVDNSSEAGGYQNHIVKMINSLIWEGEGRKEREREKKCRETPPCSRSLPKCP